VTTAAAIAVAAHRLDDVLVLHNRPLRDGVALHDTARFRDDVWPLAPATLQRHERGLVLDFTTVAVRYRLAVKQLCYTLLSGDRPPGEPAPTIGSVVGIFYKVRTFLNWVDRRPLHPRHRAAPRVCELTAADLDDYQRHLQATYRSDQYRRGHRSAIRYLWRYRQVLDDHALPFDPYQLPGWFESTYRPAVENTTDRIPEQVHGPLLVWSLRFIDDFAPDILTALDTWRTLRGPGHGVSRDGHGRNTGVLDDLRTYLDDHLAQHRPLPGHRGKPNIHLIALHLRCAGQSLRRYQQTIDKAAAVVGLTDHTSVDVAITGHVDGQPWLDDIAVDPNRDNGLSILSRMLQAACYVVIAFLSGMRESEVKHLRRGCLSVQRDERGTPYRWIVSSLAFKGETDPTGVPATWVIGVPAARAIRILERLHQPGVDWLFGALRVVPGTSPSGRTGTATLTLAATNRQLNRLITWINTYCAARGRADGIPPIDGRSWQLTTRQFRRTLAWFIARRPGGTIAGAIAYRHHSIQMFEGYAGTSESGFRAEVESEQALARGEHLLTMVNQHEHQHLTGPAANEAARRLDQLGEQARFKGITITDRRRLQRLLTKHDPAVYPGTYATCVYDHAKALCQQKVALSGQMHPDLANCQPLACRNIALSTNNIAAWHAERDHLNRRLTARPPLPPLLQAQMQNRRDQIEQFLAAQPPDAP
jgi:hypothetical protein